MPKKSSEILREIADTLENKQNSYIYICYYLLTTYKGEPKAQVIKDRIMRSLYPYLTVSRWLEDEKRIEHNYDEQRLRKYRARWCRWMAQGYEKIGD